MFDLGDFKAAIWWKVVNLHYFLVRYWGLKSLWHPPCLLVMTCQLFFPSGIQDAEPLPGLPPRPHRLWQGHGQHATHARASRKELLQSPGVPSQRVQDNPGHHLSFKTSHLNLLGSQDGADSVSLSVPVNSLPTHPDVLGGPKKYPTSSVVYCYLLIVYLGDLMAKEGQNKYLVTCASTIWCHKKPNTSSSTEGFF